MGIPVPSKWTAVEGWKGDALIVKGSVTFKTGDEVEINWKAVKEGDGSFETTCRYGYQLDPRSGLPVIGNLRPSVLDRLDGLAHGTFRLVGGQLRFRMEGTGSFSLHEPRGELFLILKPGNR